MSRSVRLIFIIFLIRAFLSLCDSSTNGDGAGGGGSEGGGNVKLGLEDAFPGENFERPVDVQNAGDGTNRVFVVEQKGVIKVAGLPSVINTNNTSGEDSTKQEGIGVFLDIQDRVFFDQGES